MSESQIRLSGTTAEYKPDAGGKSNNITTPVIGIVKSTIDTTRTGTIKVYLAALGGSDPENASNWIQVRYMSPFWGSTTPQSNASDYGDYINSPHSYGFWATPPDINAEVICLFVNGKLNQGYYIGSIPKIGFTHMTPAIGASAAVVPNNTEAATYGGATRLPVVEINNANPKTKDSPTQFDSPRAVHSYQAGILNLQGIIRDSIRGSIGSSAVRESPSNVFGMSTPGRPIYKNGSDDARAATTASTATDPTMFSVKARRGGHSFVMDDGDIAGNDQLIRLRSAAGHQITMSDDGETLFLIHANGLSWVELGKGGTVDVYATNSINLRTQGDFNIHADQDINMHAGRNINTYAAQDMNVEVKRDHNSRVGRSRIEQIIQNSTIRVGGSTLQYTAGSTGIGSGAGVKFSGSRIDLNTAPVSDPKDIVRPQVKNQHTDTKRTEKGYLPAPMALESITTRAPAHHPWVAAGLEVDLQRPVNNDQPSMAAQTPPAATTAAQSASGSAPPAQATTANTNSVPPVTTPPASQNARQPTPEANQTSTPTGTMNTQANGAPVSNTTQMSQTATAQAAQAEGSGADPNSATNTAVLTAIAPKPISAAATSAATAQRAVEVAQQIPLPPQQVGVLGLTGAQLENAGVIKPGAGKVVEQNLTAGFTYEQAAAGMTTGTANVLNNQVQAQTYANLLGRASNVAVSTGMIRGTENPLMVLGVVKAVADVGQAPVARVINSTSTLSPDQKVNVASAGLSAVSGIPVSPEAVKSVIAGGNYAAKLASGQTSTGSLSSTIKNGAASIRDAITGKFNSLKTQTPVATPEGALNTITAALPQLGGKQPNFLGAYGTNVEPLPLTPEEEKRVRDEAINKGQNPDTAVKNFGIAKRIAQGLGIGPSGSIATATKNFANTVAGGDNASLLSKPGESNAPSMKTPLTLAGVVGGVGALVGIAAGPGNPGLSTLGNSISSVSNAISRQKANVATGSGTTSTAATGQLTQKQVGNLVGGTISQIVSDQSGVGLNLAGLTADNLTATDKARITSDAISKGQDPAKAIQAAQVGKNLLSAVGADKLGAIGASNLTTDQRAAIAARGEAQAGALFATLGVDAATIAKLKAAGKASSSQAGGETKAPVLAQGTNNLKGAKQQLSGLITDGGSALGIPLPAISGEQVTAPTGAQQAGAQIQNLVSPEFKKLAAETAALKTQRDQRMKDFENAGYTRVYSDNPQDPALLAAEADAKAAYQLADKKYQEALKAERKAGVAQFASITQGFGGGGGFPGLPF
jgi:hypothetical protein